MILYHSTPQLWDPTRRSPAWFATDWAAAQRWHSVGLHLRRQQRTYILRFSGLTAGAQTLEEHAQQIWHGQPFTCSMLDLNVGEFTPDDIREFINRLALAGYEGAEVPNCDPRNFEGAGGSTSVLVFKPATSVQMMRLLIDERLD